MTTDGSEPEVHDLAAAYALDALDDAERAAFERHVSSSAALQAEVAEHRATLDHLADATAVEPPATVRADVLAAIADTPQVSDPDPAEEADPAEGLGAGGGRAAVLDLDRRGQRSGPDARWSTGRRALIAGAAAVLVVAGTVAVLLAVGSSGGGDVDPVDAVLAAPDATTADLDPTEADDDVGAIEVILSAERGQVAVVAEGLAPIGDDEAYALWFVLDEGVAPAGLFVPDDGGRVRAVLDVDPPAVTGWGVTVEPAAGSPQPTSDILYLGDAS